LSRSDNSAEAIIEIIVIAETVNNVRAESILFITKSPEKKFGSEKFCSNFEQ